MAVTTIQLDKSLVNSLKEVREYPRQTYNELIKNMVHVFKSIKNNNQYDEFLHKIQQAKMKELWNNKEDEAWQNV
jgi:rRNA pseudouridine-1189 N-methylase Emg1 (Nep1/Mra1 family)